MRKLSAEVIWVELQDLSSGISPRTGGIDPAHVAALVETEGQWPPILVNRADGRVIDGHHRVEAARIIGWSSLPVVLFDGSAVDAYVEAVRRNVQHGLPLTVGERRAAALHLLDEHVDWSDRRIAEVCALSARTVGRLRAEFGPGVAPPVFRMGRDGRDHPSAPKVNRLRIVDAVRSNPDASLRVIAHAVGASPETVRRIRHDIAQQGCEPSRPDHPAVPDSSSDVSSGSADGPAVKSLHLFSSDRALTATSQGESFAGWFEDTDPGKDWRTYAVAVPSGFHLETSAEARRRSIAWYEFATLLEDRCRPTRAV